MQVLCRGQRGRGGTAVIQLSGEVMPGVSVAAPTIEAALDARFLSGAKDERVAASEFFASKGLKPPTPAEVNSCFCSSSVLCLSGCFLLH